MKILYCLSGFLKEWGLEVEDGEGPNCLAQSKEDVTQEKPSWREARVNQRGP